MNQYDITAVVWLLLAGVILLVGLFTAHAANESYLLNYVLPMALLTAPSWLWLLYRARAQGKGGGKKKR